MWGANGDEQPIPLKKYLVSAIGIFLAAFVQEYVFRERPLSDVLWHGLLYSVTCVVGSLSFEGISRFSEMRNAAAERERKAPSRFDLDVAIDVIVLVSLLILIALYARDKLVAFALLGLLVGPVLWKDWNKSI